MREMSVAFAITFLLASGCATHGKSSADSALTDRLRAALDSDHLATVNATVSNGVATLTGTVASEVERETAQADAERIDGVRAVANRIRLSPK